MARRTNRHGRNVIRATRMRRKRKYILTPEQKRRYDEIEDRINQLVEDFDKEFKRVCIALSLVLIITIVVCLIVLLTNG